MPLTRRAIVDSCHGAPISKGGIDDLTETIQLYKVFSIDSDTERVDALGGNDRRADRIFEPRVAIGAKRTAGNFAAALNGHPRDEDGLKAANDPDFLATKNEIADKAMARASVERRLADQKLRKDGRQPRR